jgi:hypothetical protein
MYARVATWEGGEADAIRSSVASIDVEAGPPPNVPAKGLMMLIDPDNGRTMSVVLFETEEDLRAGDAALSAMNPDTPPTGSRTGVHMYEVAVDVRT